MSAIVWGIKVRDVQRLLDVGAPEHQTAKALQRILKLKGGEGIVYVVLTRLAGSRTVSRINDPYRAAYVINASKRIDSAVQRGLSLAAALRSERRFYRQHSRANQVRRTAEKRDAAHAKLYGPLLGWYSRDDARVSPECALANGKNYEADKGTKIGRPGSVHPTCRCTSGRPHKGAKMVNQMSFKGMSA